MIGNKSSQKDAKWYFLRIPDFFLPLKTRPKKDQWATSSAFY